jgi:predicted Rossmann-fold nucleotide-binding protein
MNIAVYCSSSNHIPESYKDSAYALGQWIADSGNALIFGGATGGFGESSFFFISAFNNII